MSDTYQAVYDATRSKISRIDSDVVERAAHEAFDISYVKERLQEQIYAVSHELTRPSVLFRPTISADGTAWIALLGDNIQIGVVGVGDTPAAAMEAFDQAFWKGLTPAAQAKSVASTEDGHVNR